MTTTNVRIQMIILRSIRNISLVLFAIAALAVPAEAQQRIQIGDLLQRIDRLETEVTRLRVSSGGGGDVVRLDQIEQELRRLTGIIERLEFDSRKANSASSKRLDSFESRLSALEEGGAGPVSRSPLETESRPPLTANSNFVNVAPPQGPEITTFAPPIETTPQFQPQATFNPPQDVFQAQRFEPQPAPQAFQNADVLYDEGIRLLNIGSFDQAGAQFEDLIASHPQDPKAGQAQFWLGDMHFKLGRYEQAASAFLDSFRNWPDGQKAPDSLLKLGMTLANIGKTEEACLSFKQVPARYPGAPPALLRRADIESQRFRCGG